MPDSALVLADRDMELNLISRVLDDNEMMYRANVEMRHFGNPELAEIWGILQAAIRQGQRVTPESFRAVVGGELGQYVSILAYEGWPILQPEQYGATMRQNWLRRHVRTRAEELIDALECPEAELGSVIVDAVQDLRNSMEVGELADGSVVHASVLRELDEPLSVYFTGLNCLDEIMMGGLQSGMFYGLGGRYKAGKSFLLTTLSYNLLSQCKHVYLTLESSKEQLYKRLVARAMGVNVNEFLKRGNRQNSLFRKEVDRAKEKLSVSGLLMQTVPRMDLNALRSVLEQAVLKHGIRGAMVDYMQLVGGDPKASRALHYEDVAQTLAELTREFGIWIVAAAQMNQEGNVRWGEGLLMACDMALILNPCDENEPGIEKGDMWVEMKASRYTKVQNAGAPDRPALRLDARVGPHFREMT